MIAEVAEAEEIDGDVLPEGESLRPYERFKYGVIWAPLQDNKGRLLPHEKPDWMIEKETLAAPDDQKPAGWMGKAYHMQRFITEVWGIPNDLFVIEWNPNALKILKAYCENKITAIAGHASSGKSFIFAALGVAEFLINPLKTKVLVTSYSKQSAQGKIWGDIQNCWTVAGQRLGSLPGRLLLGKYMIRYEVGSVKNPKAGIELLAGEQSEVKDSTKKIQGYKADSVIVIGDEYATLPIAIHNDVLSNLKANPDSRLLAGFNPDGHHDPGGLVSKPVGGWAKASVDMDGWPTALGGYCVHFDAEKSPNILDINAKWKGLITHQMIREMREVFPKGTKQDDQMVRAFWSQLGARLGVVDEADIEKFGADRRERRWVGPREFFAGLDIANAHGGDKVVLVMGQCGDAKNDAGEIHRVAERLETLVLNENTELDLSISEQTVASVKYHLQEGVWGPDTALAGQRRNIPTENLAVDCTGGGTHFAALLARDIGISFLMVGFGEAPSDMQVSRNDKRKGKEAFANKASELWGIIQQLTRTAQLRNIDPDTVWELTVRTYKDDAAKRMQIESKPEMKKRTNGQSPDRADGYSLFVEICRQRGGLSSSEKAAPGGTSKKPRDESKLIKGLQEYFGSVPYVDSGGGGWAD